MINTYNDLLNALTANLKRDDLTAHYSNWIQFFEAHANRTIRVPDMEKRVYTTATGEYLGLPDDFLALRDIQINVGDKRISLDLVSPDFANAAAEGGDRPKYYCIVDYQIQFAPATFPATDVEVVYYSQIPALETATTNWLIQKAPDAYLYGVLLEAEGFIENDNRIPVWKARMQEALAGVVSAGNAFRSGGSMAMRLR
jgi:hypothetical protein